MTAFNGLYELGTVPHCDQSVLHAPASHNEVGALLSQDGNTWALCTSRIGEAPWPMANASTLPVRPAPAITPHLAIPLTRPAWNALLSRASNRESDSGQTPRRARVDNVELSIVRRDALDAWLNGAEPIRQLQHAGRSSPRLREHAPHGVGSLCAAGEKTHAQTADLVFLGTSWSLITRTAWSTEPSVSLDLSGRAPSSELLPSWIGSIWSVLTAIESELTSEQWLRENDRLSRGECEHCDAHPDWQALRHLWDIAFTGHAPAGEHQLPCPSDQRRGTGQAHTWGGNRPTEVDAPQEQTFASKVMYGWHNR